MSRIVSGGKLAVRLTVYDDATKAEAGERSQWVTVGWFRDEVAALAAVCERELMRSAILPELRKLPTIEISCEYRHDGRHHPSTGFRRGVVAKNGKLGRRIVLRPGASGKGWLQV